MDFFDDIVESDAVKKCHLCFNSAINFGRTAMDVNTNLATIPPTVKQSEQRIQELAVQQPKTTVKNEIENDNDRDDTVRLSPQAQQLNRAASQQNAITVPSISNSEQARNTVNQLVTDIQNQPNMAAVSNVNSDRVRSLLG